MWKIVTLVAVAVAGCSQAIPDAQPVNIVGSDFCQIMDKRLTWDVADTRETIKGIRRLNAKWDTKCGRRPAHS